MNGAAAWYRRPSALIGVMLVLCPSVYIFRRGVFSAWSPKSYSYFPLTRLGADDDWAATNVQFRLPLSTSPAKGSRNPPKLLQPPRHPIMISGLLSMASN